jgi:predicted  nucleic acid-binding Zn-ribbon protein
MASSDLEQRVKRLEDEVHKLVARGETDRAELGELKDRMSELTEYAHKTEALRREPPTEAPPDAIP